MKEKAYAKINLSLDITGVRDDGYHELKSIMLPIDFYDVLDIKIAQKDSYKCNWKYIQYNEHNSIYKMISLLKEKYNLKDHYAIDLKKSVPIQAGLGGGTADAAAALKIFERLYNLNLSKEEIKELCVKVGADVLFNYYNKAALVTGIGDEIEAINVKDQYYVLLIKPHTGISTKEAYKLFDINDCDHPDIDKLVDVLDKGDSIEGLLGNSLQKVACILNDDIKKLLDKLNDLNARNVLMSGSGSTVFSISKDKNELIELYNLIKDDNFYTRLIKIMNK